MSRWEVLITEQRMVMRDDLFSRFMYAIGFVRFGWKIETRQRKENRGWE